jgi:predicted PurR-regulated permease PerM
MTDPARKNDDITARPALEAGPPRPLAAAAEQPPAPPGDGRGSAQERRKRQVGWRTKDVVRTAALVMGLYVLARLIWFANPLFLTAFLGVLFGLAVSSGVDKLQRFRIPRGIGAALIVLGFIGLLFGFGAWIAPTVREQTTELRRRLPESLDRVQSWLDRHQGGLLSAMLGATSEPPQRDSAAADQPVTRDSARAGAPTPADSSRVDSARAAGIAPGAAPAPHIGSDSNRAASDSGAAGNTLRQRITQQAGRAAGYLFPVLSSTLAAIGGFLIILFLSIYIGADPELYHRGIMLMFPRPARRRAGEVLSAMANVLRRWLVTQLIAMAAIGIVTTVVLLILRVKAAFALGILAGLFEFIPTVGPILSALPAIAMGFLDSPQKALYVAVAFWGIQFAENHLLIPLLMKGGVDVPPALTILAQSLMAIVFGFLGLMCAVPLTAATIVAVKMLYVEDVVGERVAVVNEDPARDAPPG